MTRVYVLDSSAIIAQIRHQPGYFRVHALLQQAQALDCQIYMSEINVGEVLYVIEREKGLAGVQNFISTLKEGPIQLVPASFERIQSVAHLKAHYPVSYADAFAAVLAQELNATLVTSDPEFHAVQHLLHIEWLSERTSERESE